jgi:GNAT superfamily N-acetyltransferase
MTIAAGPPLLRDAHLADAATLVAFNCALARETEGKELDAAVVDRGVRRLLGDPARGRYIVATLPLDGVDRVVGQLMITREWSDWRDGWFFWIQSVFVEPAFRRRGIYRALHSHVLALARAAHVDGERVCGLRLYVECDNSAARRTYVAQGMAHTYDVMEQGL